MGFLLMFTLLASLPANGQGFLVMQNWYIQGAPDASYFEGFGIHRVGMVYQNTLGSPAIESNTRTAADNTVNKYYNNIVMLDYEYQLMPDPREIGDAAAIDCYKSMCRIARWFKSQRPTIKTGFFDYLPLGQPDGKSRSFWAGNRSMYNDSLASWQAADNKVRFLADSVDYLSPGLYPWYPDTTEWCNYARANLAEAKRIARGKPVYPIITPQGFSGPGFPSGALTLGVPVGHDYMARMLKVLKEAGANGVIVWLSTFEGPNNYQWDANAGWWLALKEFMSSLSSSSISVPSVPILVAPVKGMTDQPTSIVARWRVSPGATRYQLQVADNSTFQNPLINDSTLVDTLRQVSSLTGNTRYYCRVRAKGTLAWSNFCMTADFVTGTSKSLDVGEDGNAPLTYALFQNFPNPFNPKTMIRYCVPVRSIVSIKLFNTLGEVVRQLVNGEQEAGLHEVNLDSAGLASGIYFYRFQADDFVATKKLVILK